VSSKTNFYTMSALNAGVLIRLPSRPSSPIEREIFDIWCQVNPAGAFIGGRSEFAGKAFVPSHENVDATRKRIGDALNRSETESQRKLLLSLDTGLSILEPCNVLEYLLETFFGHMVKEGIKPPHLINLADYSGKALSAFLEAHQLTDWTIGQKLLAEIRCSGLIDILSVVRKTTKSKALKSRVDDLMGTVAAFEKRVHVDGYSSGSFDEIWRIIRERGCAMGREQIYAQALNGLYDYPENPSEVEEKGLRFLQSELGDFTKLTHELADELGCDPNSETVTKAIREKKSLKMNKIIAYINQVRRIAVKVVNKRVVGINPKYATKVIETPSYLTGIFPSGGAFFFNYLTPAPKQIFITTLDPKRDPSTVPSELVNLLIHEEYGHCVHSSNSACGYAAKPAFVEMLDSTLGGAISEGMSFQRELEFLDYLNKVDKGMKLTAVEKTFLKSWSKLGGFETFRREYEFFTKAWRMTRFLRVIGDARINSGKQDLADFIEWGNKETGLSKSTVYFQVFPAHQGIGPGYASTYAIVGESIREIQKRAVTAGKDLVKLNTYASSLGFTPRTVFESRLREFQ
jgi:hypothetical protein